MGFIFTLILFAATLVLSEVLKPKPRIENARPASLGDFQFPTATEDRVIPLIWGTVRLNSPNVIWYGDLRQRAITEKVKTGLFSSKSVTKGFRYNIGVQMALCRGGGDSPLAEQPELLRVFVDDEEVFSGSQGEGVINIDRPGLFGGDDRGNGGISGDLSVRVGTEDQTIPTYLEAFQPVPGLPGRFVHYRGTMFVTWEGGYIGNSTNIAPWNFEVRRIPNGLGLGTPTVNGGNDLNPMNAIFEIMTNDEWGLGFPAADIDTAAFTAAATTLLAEGNGLSFIWDSEREVSEILREIERQIDGVVFLDRSTGKWTVTLARGGYDIDAVPQVTDPIEIRDFTRGAWEDTTNFIQVRFSHRGREYQGTFAPAIDHGNIFIQGGTVKKSILDYPMVKDPSLANSISWRDLRTLSFPLARAKLVVDRSFYAVNPGDVIAWTGEFEGLQFTKLPMRVNRVDLGEIDSNRITLDVVQDVFTFESPAFADPDAGDWEPPSDTLVAIPADESVVFEAPRAFLTRNGDGADDIKVWAGARNQGDGAVSINLLDNSGTGFTLGGEVFAFFPIGELTSDLGKPTGTISISSPVNVTATPDNVNDILEDIPEGTATITELGQDLVNLALIGTEIVAFRSAAQGAGSTVDLSNVYRGLLDTAQQDHPAGTPVYFLGNGGNMSDRIYADAITQVTVKLQTVSLSDTLLEGSAPNIVVPLQDRAKRPYLPQNATTNTSVFPTTTSIDSTFGGTGLDERGILVSLRRRDFRQTDETANLGVDAATVFADYPAANNSLHLIEVVEDPDGSPSTLFTTDPSSLADFNLTRTKILRENGGSIPSRLELRVTARHTVGGVVFDNLETLDWAFDVTSAFSGLDELGVLDTNDVSAITVAVETATQNVSIGTALPLGDVQFRLNGGSWTTCIASGATAGTIPGVTIGDQIEFRHTDSSAAGVVETTLLHQTFAGVNQSVGVLVT